MKLNEHAKNELRKEIEDAVKRVPDGQRIHLDKELIDDLIFLKLKDKIGVTVKFPIWTGEFLRKIDLSEISFEDVHLSPILYCGKEYFDPILLNKFNNFRDGHYLVPIISSNIPEEDLKNISDIDIFKKMLIDFSYTNINIDFSKIHENKVEGVNFKGVDLSFSKVMRSYYKYSNLSSTNCKLNSDFFNFVGAENFYNCSGCDFSNNDFSDITVAIFSSNFEIPNLSNTGIHLSTLRESDELTKYLSIAKKRGNLHHCYVNSEYIEFDIDVEKKKRNEEMNKLKKEYDIMKNDIFETTLGSIEDQIKGFKGK